MDVIPGYQAPPPGRGRHPMDPWYPADLPGLAGNTGHSCVLERIQGTANVPRRLLSYPGRENGKWQCYLALGG
jgi:hypothetical protein